MNTSNISWTTSTWNPVSGCKPVSAGCKYCYANALADRFKGHKAFPKGFELTYRPHRLPEPSKKKTPTLIFINSTSDLFWSQISDAYRDKIFDIIRETPRHEFQLLTKRPQAMLRYFKNRQVPANLWCGVTVESQQYIQRVDLLRQLPADVRWISLEPLLSSMELDLAEIDWVVVGGESGTHLWTSEVAKKRALVEYVNKQWVPRPSREDWVRNLRDKCDTANVPFFFKQWGGATPKVAGSVLDGVTWEQMPR